VSRDVTLVEAEVIDDLALHHNLPLAPGETRRNLTTRGVRLNDLVGKVFRIGAVLCEGTALCEPCRHLEALTGRTLLRALVHRGGLRARFLSSGAIGVGDVIQPAVIYHDELAPAREGLI
jgi:MOSC domain-containing protein YiiM